MFGLCVDKMLIYTDEMWFPPQNIEEAKCILEGTWTCVKVKHQPEKLIKRTPSLTTSNCKPWKVILHEKDAILNRIHHYKTSRPMPQLKEWGQIELDLLMWIRFWQKLIDRYSTNTYHTFLERKKQH